MSIIFDQLRISDDGRRMYINLHVNRADYFKDIYLDSLTIMTADKVSETDPNLPTEDVIYETIFDDETKEKLREAAEKAQEIAKDLAEASVDVAKAGLAGLKAGIEEAKRAYAENKKN